VSDIGRTVEIAENATVAEGEIVASIDTARSQALGIQAAINGDSSAVNILGSMGSDPHPERLLAVGLAHAQNAIGELIAIVERLQGEIDRMRGELNTLRQGR